MECFTADFLRFFTDKRQNLALGWTAGYSPSNPSISGILLKFPNFLLHGEMLKQSFIEIIALLT